MAATKLARKDLQRFYGKHLPKKMRELFDNIVEHSTPAEAVQLDEELAMSRAVATQIVQLGSLAFEDQAKEKLKTEDMVFAADLIQRSMNHVRDMAIAASRIEKDAELKVSMRVINVFVDRIIRAVNEACGNDFETAQKIIDHINETVVLPNEGEISSTGTEITPDQQVCEMDRMILGELGNPINDNDNPAESEIGS
jgi:hypothetical protein